jgi:hypothetical protein
VFVCVFTREREREAPMEVFTREREREAPMELLSLFLS